MIAKINGFFLRIIFNRKSIGSAIKASLEDEDDFAMLAENLFTDLDVEDSGKVSSNAFRTALQNMGLEMGVPDPSG